MVVFGGIMAVGWAYDSIARRDVLTRGLEGVAGHGAGVRAAITPALAQSVRFLGSTYAGNGDLSPREVQLAAARLGLNPISHGRGKLRYLKAALARGRTPVILVNARKLPGRRVGRAWYPIVVLAVAGSWNRQIARIVDPVVGRPEDLDAYEVVDAWKADDRFVTTINVLRALGPGKPPEGAPRMWLELSAY